MKDQDFMKRAINIILLCNSRLAFPAMQKMLDAGMLRAIGCSDRQPDIISFLKAKAEQYGVPFKVFSKPALEEQLLQWLSGVQHDVVFVMTFPWKIPGKVLSVPELGFINFHYGLLPEMRGADPIFESIRLQKSSTGLSIHVMDEDFDTGPLVVVEKVDFGLDETYGMLSSRMAWLGEKLCMKLVEDLAEGNGISKLRQENDKAVYYPRIPAESLGVNWNVMTAAEIKALVNACNPITKGVPVLINNWKIGLCSVSEISLEGDASGLLPGSILTLDHQNGLLVFCKDAKALKLEVVYTEEGVFPGYALGRFGLAAGMQFN
jgi:methionyl-tRNA formyltransferase